MALALGGQVGFQLLLHCRSHFGFKRNIHVGRPVQEDDALDQPLGMTHLFHRTAFGQTGQPAVAPVLTNLRLHHVLHNRGQLVAQCLVQSLNYFLISLHQYLLLSTIAN